MPPRIHSTALIESDVQIGEGTAIYDHVHIRHHATIGKHCIVGGKTLIAYEVVIDDFVKINSNVYICYGVTIERGVMIGAGTIFTNDRFPRATNPELTALRESSPDEHTMLTRVREGASIGAGAIIGADLEIGRFAMVGMGAVVTRSVPDFHLAVGNPAKSVGVVCRCGPLVYRFDAEPSGERVPALIELACEHCRRQYQCDSNRVVTEIN